MLNEIFINDEKLCLTIGMPFYYTNEGKRREITKNTKTNIMMGRQGIRVAKNPALVEWLEYFKLEGLVKKPIIIEWGGNDKQDYRVIIYWHLYSFRTDAHNYNEVLLDGLQNLTGINDRHMYPMVYGKVRSKVTFASVIMERITINKQLQGRFNSMYGGTK